MVNINISVKEEAYDFLKKLKSKDKSFSDVILSFKKDTGILENFFAVLKDLDWDKKEKKMKELRQSFDNSSP